MRISEADSDTGFQKRSVSNSNVQPRIRTTIPRYEESDLCASKKCIQPSFYIVVSIKKTFNINKALY